MNCPKCDSDKTALMMEDAIKCSDCGKTQSIQYWYCWGCEFTFRFNNKKFMDGWKLDVSSVETGCKDMTKALQNPLDSSECIMDFLRPCPRCDDSATYESIKGVYCCSNCSFEWEILENG